MTGGEGYARLHRWGFAEKGEKRWRRRPRHRPHPWASDLEFKKGSTAQEAAGGEEKEDLLGQLIQDLNEINEVPFFDVQLPYELALKIFQFLDRTELGRCAQVSRTWKVLAEDQVLWFRLCQQEGYLLDNQISDFPCWKMTLQECRAKEQALRANWKNRIGAVSQLQYELGKVLCDVHSCDGVIIAGNYVGALASLPHLLRWTPTLRLLCHLEEAGREAGVLMEHLCVQRTNHSEPPTLERNIQ